MQGRIVCPTSLLERKPSLVDRIGNFGQLSHVNCVAVNGTLNRDPHALRGLGVFQQTCGAVVALVIQLVELVISIDGVTAALALFHESATRWMVLGARVQVFGRLGASVVD